MMISTDRSMRRSRSARSLHTVKSIEKIGFATSKTYEQLRGGQTLSPHGGRKLIVSLFGGRQRSVHSGRRDRKLALLCLKPSGGSLRFLSLGRSRPRQNLRSDGFDNALDIRLRFIRAPFSYFGAPLSLVCAPLRDGQFSFVGDQL
jgi:hypothetical protein